MYDKNTMEHYETYTEKGKDFQANSVTCLSVHPERSDYVLIGYHFGQIALLDVTDPRKAVKIVKDAHKGQALVNLKFC